MPKISVIIPVYNTEKYLAKCLDSVINQTLEDIEIICINDGSTDNSDKILLEYANKDSRIKIIEQRNMKQGAARNRGFEIAQGEYIGYVDSDDWIDLDYYEKLYCAAVKSDSDIALATNVRIGGKKTKKRLNIKEEKRVTGLQDKFDICKQFKDQCPVNKIYRKDFLVKNNITWPEGVYCEDKIYTLKAVYYANAVITVPGIYYYYFRRPESTVLKNSKKMRVDKKKAKREMLDFLKQHCVNLRDCEFWAIKKEKKVLGITLYNIKESLRTEKFYLLGIIPCLTKQGN